MLQSSNYILTPDFINNSYRKINLEEASTLWSIIHDPKSTTLEQVLNVIFDPRSHEYSGMKRRMKRYFVQDLMSPLHSSEAQQQPDVVVATTDHQQQEPAVTTNLQEGEDDDTLRNTIDFTIDRVPSPPANHVNLATRIIEHCRRTSSAATPHSYSRQPNYPTEDFVDLSQYEERANLGTPLYYCPPNIDEMTQIVRSIRSNHPMYAPPIRVNNPNVLQNLSRTNDDADKEYDESNDNIRFNKKQRRNNYELFCSSSEDEEK